MNRSEEVPQIPVIPNIDKVVHLAGKTGYALEKFYNTELAAMLIYRESGSPINPARFYDANEDALKDIARCAGAALKDGEGINCV